MADMSLREFHRALAWGVVGSNAAAGLWCLGAHRLAALRRREQWWLVIASQVLVAIQVGVGVWLFTHGRPEPHSMHVFYGFVTLITVALLYAYRAQLRAHMYLLYGFGCLFMMGLGLRAIYLT